MKFLLQTSLCFTVFAALLFAFVQQNNELMMMRQKVYEKRHVLSEVHEEVVRKEVEIRQFSSPEHLLGLLKEKQFSNLTYPNDREVVLISNETP